MLLLQLVVVYIYHLTLYILFIRIWFMKMESVKSLIGSSYYLQIAKYIHDNNTI